MEIFKIVLCLAALCTVALGSKCYDCAFKDSDTSKKTINDECKAADSKHIHPCDDSQTHCLKIVGLVDGKPAGLRECAGNSWATLVKNDDACVPTSSLPNFIYKHEDKVVDLVNGTICVCHSEACNGQGKIFPSSYGPALVMAAVGLVIPALY